MGGFGAGTFLETRRRTFGLDEDGDDVALLDATGDSAAVDGKDDADVGELSEGCGSGCRELADGTGEVEPAGFVTLSIQALVLAELLTFCGVVLTELLPRLSYSPNNNHIQIEVLCQCQCQSKFIAHERKTSNAL